MRLVLCSSRGNPVRGGGLSLMQHTNPSSGRLLGSAFRVREVLVGLRMWFLRKVLKMDIHPSAKISLRANLDLTNASGIHIDEGTYVAFHAVVLAHDMSRLIMTDTYIGKNCFIGAYSIVMPGIRIGDECIVGCGSVVTADVPSRSIVAGNPANVIRSNIRTIKWGILKDAYAKSADEEAAARGREVRQAAGFFGS
jgi:serine acetyltransferase